VVIESRRLRYSKSVTLSSIDTASGAFCGTGHASRHYLIGMDQTLFRETNVVVDDVRLHLLQAGRKGAPSFLFVHGWPQNSEAFRAVMADLSDDCCLAAIDLPGVGRSVGQPRAADKRTLAHYVRAAMLAADLRNVTLVGHDIGGQIVYAYLQRFAGTIERAAILNVAIPGVPPWSEVAQSPRIWHFGFHAVPQLPELLVTGHEAAYFDFFFDAIAANRAAITPQARRAYAEAYSSATSLKAGFDWYRAFPQDERDNAATAGSTVATPVLYVRGDAESGELKLYVDGLRQSGLINIQGRSIANCGHFSPDEQPRALAEALRAFVRSA
jgi:pimeloyl-ACP methyl ester carboxylesterase